MDLPPLSLTVLQLTPPSCIPNHPAPAPLTSVPRESIDWPSLPSNFSISPSPHYAGPFGTMSLGETFSTSVRLANTSSEPVRGVKMMLEMQGPNGRFRLGEIVHDDGQTRDEGVESELEVQGEVEMDVKAEMKDVGVNLLICSVAWETASGRKTFQRFFKFNVSPPLAIKTRVHSPSSPSVLLDPARRSDLHLEVLVQNTSTTGLAFDKVVLEPVRGLLCHPTTEAEYKDKPSLENDTDVSTLFPDDTRQYLFTLSPDPDYPPRPQSPEEGGSEGQTVVVPRSVFPPTYDPGTILPLGRLDVAWFSAPYRNPGRLQTSTLNRRVAVPTPPVRPLMPTRTSTALPPTPGGAPLASPRPQARASEADAAGSGLGVKEPGGGWEYDLVLLHIERQVEIERQFEVTLRLAVRSSVLSDDQIQPPSLRLGLQYLSHPPSAKPSAPSPSLAKGSGPTLAIHPPSRSATPLSPPPRSFASPPPTVSASAGAGPSRPMTPVSSQLRQATSSSIGLPPSTPKQPDQPALAPPSLLSTTSFPPPPYLSHATPALQDKGQVTHLGCSLIHLPHKPCVRVQENTGTTYIEPTEKPAERWEVVHEHTFRFMALDEGMSELGGVRVVTFDDQSGLKGGTGREWETLGDVWVTA